MSPVTPAGRVPDPKTRPQPIGWGRGGAASSDRPGRSADRSLRSVHSADFLGTTWECPTDRLGRASPIRWTSPQYWTAVIDPVTDLLAEEPLVLLGLVLAVGAILGSFSIRGVSIGPAGALFAGLAVSAIDDRLVIPSIVGIVGLALFTYCVGLAAGPQLSRF